MTKYNHQFAKIQMPWVRKIDIILDTLQIIELCAQKMFCESIFDIIVDIWGLIHW